MTLALDTAALKTAVAALTMLLAVVLATGYAAGYRLYSVQSDSMAPGLSTGDVVLVDSRDKNISTSDVVSFRSPDNPMVIVTHRIISIDAATGSFIAKGDNTDLVDRPVSLSEVVGVVAVSAPILGHVSDALKQPVGLIAMVYLPALFVIAGEVSRLGRHYAGHTNIRYELQGRRY